MAISKEQLERERAELLIQHDGAATEAIAACLKRRIDYVDWKIAYAIVV